MERIEDILADKIGALINYALYKVVKPDIRISDVKALNKGTIRWLKERYGIEGVILDLDETLRHGTRDIPNCNKEWLETLRGELKITILSNGWSGKLEKYFKEKNINYIKLGFKPLKGGFHRACKSMGVDPSKVLMIGNDIFGDIYGGNRNNMMTAHVISVERDER